MTTFLLILTALLIFVGTSCEEKSIEATKDIDFELRDHLIMALEEIY